MVRMLSSPRPLTVEEIPQHRRAATLERVGGDARDLHDVVGHQAVPAADELEAEFALADARLAGDQHAKAEHVHENAVPLGALGERLGKIARQLVDHARGGSGEVKERRVGSSPRRRAAAAAA